MKDEYEDQLLDAPMRTPEGKEIITLEAFLAMHLRHAVYESEKLVGNATSILRWLGVPIADQSDAKRAAKWLRANGFKPTQNGKTFTVARRHVPDCRYRIV